MPNDLDMSQVITPRSDQINADDLLAGPITITITNVKIAQGEQPVSIYFEGSTKAYRPCKSMARLLVKAWGPNASKYQGRSLTLYCDPTVKWAGMEVGGIRVSHMSHIDAPLTMALTVTRGNKKPFTVQPLETKSEPLVTEEQALELAHLCMNGGRELTWEFLSMCKVETFSEIPASWYANAKKWITKQRAAEAEKEGAQA